MSMDVYEEKLRESVYKTVKGKRHNNVTKLFVFRNGF